MLPYERGGLVSFNTSLLDQALTIRQNQQEKARRILLKQLLTLLDELAEPHDLRKAYICGSLVQPGRFSANSDVDIALPRLPSGHWLDLSAALSAALGYDVDLVDMRQCRFSDKIQREGLLWTRSD
ncbi:MAG: nucleotidyltransferase domain-containing protein [Chloroflexi bacterium]|nr:nucleotidyltransferase domain-containing protein [Chloroflexota bacterium]